MLDVTEILDLDELRAIRKRFKRDETALERYSLQASAALYSEGREFVTSVGSVLYSQGAFIDPIDRELQLLALFTISREWNVLAVHIYWSILVELSPQDIAQTLLLACLSAGIDEYTTALALMTRVMQILKTLAPTDPSVEDVLAELLKTF